MRSSCVVLTTILLSASAATAVGDDAALPFAYRDIYTLEFPTLEGESKSLADFRGKKVLLHVFASW